MDLFTIEDFKPVPTKEFMAMQCVQDMYKINYNKGTAGDKDGRKRLRATRELVYVYYLCSFKSEFSNYPEQERSKEALKAAGLPEDYEMSFELLHLIGVYSHHADSGNRVLNLLKAARGVVDKLDKYFGGIELEIHPEDNLDKIKIKTELAGKVMDNLDKLPKVITNLDKIEDRVKKEQSSMTRTRGDAEKGRLE